jgi:hypothetical protein
MKIGDGETIPALQARIVIAQGLPSAEADYRPGL